MEGQQARNRRRAAGGGGGGRRFGDGSAGGKRNEDGIRMVECGEKHPHHILINNPYHFCNYSGGDDDGREV